MCKKSDVFGTMLRSTKLSSVFMKINWTLVMVAKF